MYFLGKSLATGIPRKKKMKAYFHETKPQVMQEGGLFISMTKVVSIGHNGDSYH